MRSISASTTSGGISTRRFLRVSLISRSSVFIGHYGRAMREHPVPRTASLRWLGLGIGGVEPTRPFGHKILNLARLPVPPNPRSAPLTLPEWSDGPPIEVAD